MIGPVKNASAPKEKPKGDKKVSDDYYDRVNYYEARNIFSSNEPFNPNNRLYTDHVANTHSVWNTIQQPNERQLFDQFSLISKEGSGVGSEVVKPSMGDLSRYIVSGSSTACKLCGYVGHLGYQCRNKVVLKSKKKTENEEKARLELEKFVSLEEEVRRKMMAPKYIEAKDYFVNVNKKEHEDSQRMLKEKQKEKDKQRHEHKHKHRKHRHKHVDSQENVSLKHKHKRSKSRSNH